MTGLKLAEGDLSPDSTDICAVLDSNEQFCGQKFSTQLFFDSTDPETGETTDAPLLVSVKFLHSSPEPGPQEYELANAAYAGIKAEYGDPEPLAVQDGNEHFQSLERLEELKEGPSVSRCVDSWADTGHKGMEGRTVCRVDSKQHAFGPGGWQHLYPLPLVSLEAQAAVNKRLLPF